jgi:hypothetical protein
MKNAGGIDSYFANAGEDLGFPFPQGFLRTFVFWFSDRPLSAGNDSMKRELSWEVF